jgi:hypothetical protein
MYIFAWVRHTPVVMVTGLHGYDTSGVWNARPASRMQSASCAVQARWNVMAHTQKPDFVFRRNERVHLNWRGRQFSRLLAAEVCASAVVMLYTPYSEVVWRVLATHSIRQFPLHFPSRASPCAITSQLKLFFHWSISVSKFFFFI